MKRHRHTWYSAAACSPVSNKVYAFVRLCEREEKWACRCTQQGVRTCTSNKILHGVSLTDSLSVHNHGVRRIGSQADAGHEQCGHAHPPTSHLPVQDRAAASPALRKGWPTQRRQLDQPF